jgi:cell division protein FtsB
MLIDFFKFYFPAFLQAAQRQLQQQLEAAEQLQQDVEQLKTENLETWQQKYELEGQLATARANIEGMQGQASSMQKVRMR